MDDGYGTFEVGVGGYEVGSYLEYFAIMKIKQRQERPFGLSATVLFVTYIILIWAIGNILFNWTPLRSALLEADVFKGLDGDSETVTPQREEAINAVYALGQTCIDLSGLISGTLVDFVGPRFTYMVGASMQILGTLLWCMAGSENKALYMAGSFFMGISSESCFAGFYSCCFWFPTRISMMSSLIGMSRAFSLAKSFIIMFMAHRLGLSLTLWIVTGILVASFITGSLLLPAKPYLKILAQNENWKAKIIPKNKFSKDSIKELLHIDTWIFLLYVACAGYRAAMFSSFASKFIENPVATNMLYLAMPAGGALSPVFGMIGDHQSPIAMCLYINTLLGCLYGLVWGCMVTDGATKVTFEVLTVIIYTVAMSMCAGQANLIFQAYYDFNNFGILSAGCAVVLGVFSACIQVSYKYFNSDPSRLTQMPLMMIVVSFIGAGLLFGFKHLYEKRTKNRRIV